MATWSGSGATLNLALSFKMYVDVWDILIKYWKILPRAINNVTREWKCVGGTYPKYMHPQTFF